MGLGAVGGAGGFRNSRPFHGNPVRLLAHGHRCTAAVRRDVNPPVHSCTGEASSSQTLKKSQKAEDTAVEGKADQTREGKMER